MLLTPILPVLISFAPPSTDSGHVTVGSGPALHTPDEIAPAVLPYLACLFAQRGVPFLQVALGSEVQYDKHDNDCSATRKRSQTDALKLLQDKRIPGGVAPTTYVENALADMDSFVASRPKHEGTQNSAYSSETGLPVTIEDAVEPAYHRYHECLTTQAGQTSVSADTILAIFQQVISICRSVRDAAVIEAENALAKKGWDEPRRVRAAGETFKVADEQWLAMGRQYRDYLIARMSQPERRP